MAMVLITHDLGVVAEVADHVAVMYAGRIVEYGPVDEIFDDPQHPYTIGLMGAIPSVGKREGALATIHGSVPAPEQMPHGCRFAPRCPFAEQRCIDAAPPDTFIGGSGQHRVACWVAPVELSVAPDTARVIA
jgi:peptide/nickel transport system ATP-binding protein